MLNAERFSQVAKEAETSLKQVKVAKTSVLEKQDGVQNFIKLRNI